MSTDLSVVLPSYNEAENLPAVVGEIIEQLGRDRVEVRDPHRRRREQGRHPPRRGRPRPRARAGARACGCAATSASRPRSRSACERRSAIGSCSWTPTARTTRPRSPTCSRALDGGLDLVTGRRADRQDRFVKRSTSKLYNAMTARVTGVEGRDFNSGLKAMTRDVAESLELYGELHRYIPVLAAWNGFEVGEVDVNHRAPVARRVEVQEGPVLAGFLRPRDGEVPHHLHRPAVPPLRRRRHRASPPSEAGCWVGCCSRSSPGTRSANGPRCSRG